MEGEGTMTRTTITCKRTTRKPEPAKVLPSVNQDEYARRTAKSDEVRDYIVPGYLAA